MSITKYCYEYMSQKRPFACVVYKDGKIGISVCCPKDTFNKKRGRSIALARAELGVVTELPNGVVYSNYYVKEGGTSYKVLGLYNKSTIIEQTIDYVKERANALRKS